MAFKEVTNLPSYKAQATLDFKYAPVIQRGKFLHEQASKSTFPHRREAGNNSLQIQQYVIEILHLKDCVSNLRCQVESQEMSPFFFVMLGKCGPFQFP